MKFKDSSINIPSCHNRTLNGSGGGSGSGSGSSGGGGGSSSRTSSISSLRELGFPYLGLSFT